MNKMNSRLDKQIGKLIRTIRQECGKSRIWLGKKLNISYQQVANYETGLHKITVARLHQISKHLKTSFLKFLPDELKRDRE